jgi:hypothetical protein
VDFQVQCLLYSGFAFIWDINIASAHACHYRVAYYLNVAFVSHDKFVLSFHHKLDPQAIRTRISKKKTLEKVGGPGEIATCEKTCRWTAKPKMDNSRVPVQYKIAVCWIIGYARYSIAVSQRGHE